MGVLDYEELVAKNLNQAVVEMAEVARLTTDIGEVTARYSEKLDSMKALSDRGVPVDRKSLIDEYSEVLSKYNANMEPVVSNMDRALIAGSSASLNMLQEWPLDTPEARVAVQEFADTIGATLLHMDEMIEPIGTMAAALESWPGLTKKLKISRRKAVEINRRLYAAMRQNQQTLARAQEVAQSRLRGEA